MDSWRRMLVSCVRAATFGRIRGQRMLYTEPNLRWWWVKWRWAARYGHGGWVYLSVAWWRRHRRGGEVDQERERSRRKAEWRERTRKIGGEVEGAS